MTKLYKQNKLPNKLYKYLNFKVKKDKNNKSYEDLDILKGNQVYFSGLNELNDPFEGRFKLIFKGKVSKRQLMELECSTQEEAKKKFDRLQNKLIKSVYEYLKPYRFFCLSEKRDSILAFSHYSSGHTGFCIGFDTSFFPFQSAKEVEYNNKLLTINFLDLKGAEKIILRKLKDWGYEKEWRILENGQKPSSLDDKNKYHFEEAAICEIIMGYRIEEHNKEKILDIAKQRKNIDIYKTSLNSKNYGLDLELIYKH